METFITKIYVKESRGGVRDLEIPLSETNRQHLIITGKNGSGKTGLLEEIKKFLSQIENGALNSFGGTELSFSDYEINTHNKFQKGDFILAYFGAIRLIKLNVPKGIEKFNLQQSYRLDEKANNNFIQYIVNMKADRSFARDEGNETEAKDIDKWFDRFEKQLKIIFNDDNLMLLFERKPDEYNFNIKTGNNEFGIDKLSDGYSAILSIVSELLLRMEAHNVKAYDMEGVVLVDEIETHLHVELQKRVLPFLIAFFPKIQFIVTTHSPFVISSVQNATICDLETRIITNDLTAYSYDALVESFFMTDKYSETVKEKIAEYEKLLSKQEKTIEDTENIKSLQEYFVSAKFISKELRIKLNQVELQYL